jgi:hypothetical protein
VCMLPGAGVARREQHSDDRPFVPLRLEHHLSITG